MTFHISEALNRAFPSGEHSMSKQSALEEILSETLESIDPEETLSGYEARAFLELIGKFAVEQIASLEAQLSEVALQKLSEMRGVVEDQLLFQTQEEALAFVERVHAENGGPNEKLKAMWARYEQVNQERAARLESEASQEAAQRL